MHLTETQFRQPTLWSFWFLFLVAFIEGGALMAVEIVGAKLVGPYYGSSLYVWAAVLGLTLAGLTTGYFLGGALSRHVANRRALFTIFAMSSGLVALMPWSAPVIMEATLGLDLRLGVTLSALVFLFPPLVFFGMVSPMIIRLVTTHEHKIGHAAGTVYAVSTIGGILTTYFVAFHAIPVIGMRETLLGTAMLLAAPPVLYFLRLAPRLTG
jgi:predicted membrane-bound spermidine synthase